MIRRKLKNAVNQYTDAEIKVREATSNDPWGPSSTLMSEIADLTHNQLTFSEVMQMIWKRLGDKSKNWRHVYKALLLLEYIVKTGHPKVADQCKESIHMIETLKDFQHMEDNKDYGMSIREKAKGLVALLRDDEMLKSERERALTAKERFHAKSGGLSSSGKHSWGMEAMSTADKGDSAVPGSELDTARPRTRDEESCQLEIALAVSKEEYDSTSKQKDDEDKKVKIALEQSRKVEEALAPLRLPPKLSTTINPFGSEPASGAPLIDTTGTSPPVTLATAAAGAPTLIDPWGEPVAQTTAAFDPWASTSVASTGAHQQPQNTVNDPWSTANTNCASMPTSAPSAGNGAPPTATSVPQVIAPADDFDDIFGVRTRGLSAAVQDPWSNSEIQPATNTATTAGLDPWSLSPHPMPNSASLGDLTGLDRDPVRPSLHSLQQQTAAGSAGNLTGPTKRRQVDPQQFLGENAGLVNWDNLVSCPAVSGSTNPFAPVNMPPKVSLNQMFTTPAFSEFGQPAQNLGFPTPANGQAHPNPVNPWAQPTTGVSMTAGPNSHWSASPTNPFL